MTGVSLTVFFLKWTNYTDKKLQENLDAEIMEVILDEARESYDQEIIVELQSDNTDQIDSNVDRIVEWLELWRKNNNHDDEA